jgi:hypothetical protein
MGKHQNPCDPKDPQTNPQTTYRPVFRTSNGTGDYSPPASLTAWVNDCSKTTTKNQNVKGLHDDEQLEFISRLMKKKKQIDAFILTEMHLEGDF